MVRKKSLSELEKAEIKLQSLLEKRDALNDEGRVLRQERDLVHEKKRELSGRFRELKGQRSALVAEARAHRARRDAFQQKAKALIEMRRRLRTKMGGSLGEELRRAKREVAAMELRQQTATLTLAEENELLDDLKARLRQMRELEGLKKEQDGVFKEVQDVDASITELFAHADREHKAAVEASDKARAFDEELDALVASITTLGQEGDQKHEAYLDAKAKADEIHAKVLEMREKVLSERTTKRAEAREARDLIRAQNRAVRAALLDEKKLEASADEALQALLRKGRVEIGR